MALRESIVRWSLGGAVVGVVVACWGALVQASEVDSFPRSFVSGYYYFGEPPWRPHAALLVASCAVCGGIIPVIRQVWRTLK